MIRKPVHHVLSVTVLVVAFANRAIVEIIVLYVTSMTLQFAHFAIMVSILMELVKNVMFKVVKIVEIKFSVMYAYQGTFWLTQSMQPYVWYVLINVQLVPFLLIIAKHVHKVTQEMDGIVSIKTTFLWD